VETNEIVYLEKGGSTLQLYKVADGVAWAYWHEIAPQTFADISMKYNIIWEWFSGS
jgi:hypothetical protein